MKSGGLYDISLGSLGPGLLHAWRWSLIYGSAVIPFSASMSAGSAVVPLCWNMCLLACYLFVALLGHKLPVSCAGSRATGLFSVLGSLGTMLMALSFRQGLVDPLVLSIAGVALSALAMSSLTLAWSSFFCRMDYKQVQTSAALFITFGTILFLVCAQLPTELTLVLTSMFPIASYMLLKSNTGPSAPLGTNPPKTQGNPLSVFMTCLACFSVANSYLRGLGLSAATETDGSTWSLLFCSIVATSFVLAFAKTPKLLSSIAVLCIAGGLGLLALSSLDFGTAAVGSGFICFEILTWMVITESSKRSGTNPQRIAASVWASLYFGAVAGLLLGTFINNRGGLSTNVGATASLVLAYVVLMAFVFNYNRSFLDLFAPAPDNKQPGAILAEKGEAFAQMCGLTEREREILLILISGRSAKFIAKELVISDNTVKTHIKNIYRKAEVTSKDQLLDKVAATNVSANAGEKGRISA